MRMGNTELLRSFYVSLLGFASLNAALLMTSAATHGNLAANMGFFSVLAGVACYLTLRHYRKVEPFKNQPYALFLLRLGIVLSAVALALQLTPLLRGQ